MKINKTAYLLIANTCALLILTAGLLSPLTPSEGSPSLLELAIFAGGPLFILSVMIYKAKSRIAKFVFIAEITIISSVLFRVIGAVYK